MVVCQPVASLPSEQPIGQHLHAGLRLPSLWHHPRNRQSSPGSDPDQPDVPRQVAVDHAPSGGHIEFYLGWLLSLQLTVEEVDHDSPRGLIRGLRPLIIRPTDSSTCKDQRFLGRALNHRPRTESDRTVSLNPDPYNGFPGLPRTRLQGEVRSRFPLAVGRAPWRRESPVRLH